MKIPSDNRWTQTNDGHILGVVHETHNINFDRNGEARLSKKAVAIASSDTSDFGEVMAIVYFDGNYHLVTDDEVFVGDLSSPSFSAVASSPTLGTVSDAVVVYDRLYVSDTTALAYLNTSGSWTTGIGSLTGTNPHPMAVFDSLPTYKLAVGDGYQLKTYDSGGNVNSVVLALPQNYQITTIEYRSGYLHIGTKEINGGEAAIFLWNGSGTSAQYKIDVGASWVYASVPYRGSVAFVTNEGELILLNGTSIQHLAAFPIFYENGARWEQGASTRGKVYRRGMCVIGDNIYINASGKVEIGDCARMKSGVWCYNPQVGLYHYASPSTDLLIRDSGITASSNLITTSATHNLKLGDVVQFTTVSGLSGISTGKKYYAIPVGATTLYVAGSRNNAFAGNEVQISGTATTDALQYAPNTDYGHVIDADSGAIAVTSYLDSPNEMFESDIIFGSELDNNAGSQKDVLCILSPQYNEGFISTQRVLSNNVTSVWKSVYTFIRGIFGSNESITIKTQVADKESYPTEPVSVTWATATSFAVTDPLLHEMVEVGDEVFFVEGYGQGRLAHVTEVSESLTVTTMTVDQSYGTAGGTSKVRLSNMRKHDVITSTRENGDIVRSTIDSKSSQIRTKAELKGFEPSIFWFELTNDVNKSAQ